MNNNDILIRLRYALNIKDAEIVEIFKLGDVKTTIEEVQEMLLKLPDDGQNEAKDKFRANEYYKEVDNFMLESFLNGLITLKRGKRDSKPEDSKNQFLMSADNRNVNNILLKKVKIALSLTNEDMLDVIDDAGVYLSKSELSAVLRREGHRNYKACGDRYARNFLKGLAIRYRD